MCLGWRSKEPLWHRRAALEGQRVKVCVLMGACCQRCQRGGRTVAAVCACLALCRLALRLAADQCSKGAPWSLCLPWSPFLAESVVTPMSRGP